MWKQLQTAIAFAQQATRSVGRLESVSSSFGLSKRQGVCRRCFQTKGLYRTVRNTPELWWKRQRHGRTSFVVYRIWEYSTRNGSRLGEQREDLPSTQEGRRSRLSKRVSHLMDNVQANVFIAGQRLNDLTGYSGIEALKREIECQEQTVELMRSSLQEARDAYSAAISTRASSQREVNELLQRKNTWSPQDVERFTALYRSDHASEQAEASARAHLDEIETRSEEAGARLSTIILTRYHEEQIWSDKIRRMSTWGTWGLMGVNVFLFLIFQIGVEPWRRKRLVKGFEDKVAEALEKEARLTGAKASERTPADENPSEVVLIEPSLTEGLDANVSLASSGTVLPSEAPHATEVSTVVAVPENAYPASTIESVRQSLKDIFSEREVVIKRVDLTTAMLEGFGAGIALIGVLVIFLRPH
ncbi:uncharacterized protein KY384_007713 [Bacidia gigantensis]|uniref:uncharacterized protein n=1 Tax=Bacidia gigantensis TaxID=2732470 RepID=UPI001D03AB21|nr:uncharacterized protein KY384_007713 [Bacidia gigantensis]KAG8527561.1 hypothetical protein KY384_007713 [Bacidia gigantensis]